MAQTRHLHYTTHYVLRCGRCDKRGENPCYSCNGLYANPFALGYLLPESLRDSAF